MKKDKLRRPPTAVLIAIIALIAIAGTTVAWLTAGTGNLDRVFSLSNFDVYADVDFNGTSAETYRQGGLLSVNVDNPGATNYIGNLRVDANYKGMGQFYMRLKMVQQWTDGTGKILQADAVFPYEINAAWFDNRLDDFCIYYPGKVFVANGTYVNVPLITGINMAEFNAMKPSGAVTLKIAITLEAVQVNRYPQFWGIERLPWLPPVVATTAEETTD